MSEQLKTRACIGCGYCCRAAQCGLSVRVYGHVEICPALVYHDERYWCSLVERARGPLKDDLVSELAIGAGCCSPLNSDRKNIPRPRPEQIRFDSKRAFYALTKAVASQLVSSGTLRLIALDLDHALPGLGAHFLYHAQEQRHTSVKEFMK